MRLTLNLFILSFILTTSQTYAAAYQLYELGTPLVGTAGVGQAVATDASSAYFNPAAMAFLPESELMLGAQIMLPYINFEKNKKDTILGDNGGNAAILTPGMDFYYVYQFNPCLKFGIAVTTPYGGALNYDDGWTGRYDVQYALFYAINVNPSFAFRLNDWISLGAGVAIEYMNLNQTTALPIPNSPLVDGQINIKGENTSVGANIGVMLNPFPATKIGLAYRSEITHRLHGDLTFLRIGLTPSAQIKMIMPQTVIASLSQRITCQLTLLADAGWANWSRMKNTVLKVDRYSVTTPLNWTDTYRIGLGSQFQASPEFLLQAGISYDSSPTDASKRVPELPMDRQLRVGAGLIWTMIPNVEVGASYEYLSLGNAAIDNVSTVGVLAGDYKRNFVNTLQLSVNVTT